MPLAEMVRNDDISAHIVCNRRAELFILADRRQTHFAKCGPLYPSSILRLVRLPHLPTEPNIFHNPPGH